MDSAATPAATPEPSVATTPGATRAGSAADARVEAAACAPPDPLQLARQRRRAIWLAGTLAALAVAGSAAWLVNVVTTERNLHAVTSAALPALPRAPQAAPAPPAGVAEQAAVASTAAVGAGALAAAPAVQVPSAPPGPATPPASGPAQPPATPAVSAPAASQAARPAARTAQARKSGKRAAVRRVTKRTADSATFRRCPPLGQAGAVMCRWHICNGGAGKEAACRPYLERQP